MNFSLLIKNTPGVPILLQITNIKNKIFTLETLLYQEWDNFYNKKTQLLWDLTLIAEGMALQVKKDNFSQTNLQLDVNSRAVVIWVNFYHPTFNQRSVPLNCKDRTAAIKTF
jgi:hypothetical protein